MSEDPTIQFLQELDDPAKFAIKRGVPIWVPHRRTSASGAIIHVDESDLPAYAASINQMERERGVVGRITDGHTAPDLPEGKQPRLLGYYRNARVGRFGPGKTPAVLVDCHFKRTELEIIRQRPYRSAEVYPAVKQIRGLALLIRDPWLDMGCISYQLPSTPPFARNDMADLPSIDTATALSPEEQTQAERIWLYLRDKHQLGDPLAGSQLPEQYQVELAELRTQNAGQARTICELLVDQLVSEGYSLDRDFEVGELIRRNSAEREVYLRNARQRYGRVPTGPLIPLHPGPVEVGVRPETPLTREQMERALQYQSEHNCFWETARRAVLRSGA